MNRYEKKSDDEKILIKIFRGNIYIYILLRKTFYQSTLVSDLSKSEGVKLRYQTTVTIRESPLSISLSTTGHRMADRRWPTSACS